MQLTKRHRLIILFPQPGDVHDVQTVFEETGIRSLPSLRVWLSYLRRDEQISIRIRGDAVVREQ